MTSVHVVEIDAEAAPLAAATVVAVVPIGARTDARAGAAGPTGAAAPVPAG